MPRKPFIVGNWKMFKTIRETSEFCAGLKVAAADVQNADIAVGPPFTALSAAAAALKGSKVGVAAQDVFWAETGAFTGEVSPLMIKEAGCELAIIG
ncbi:MAG TPA: triose-phosphate isomerase, partial [Thermodesulfobacteriota bacterium]|nr:triose-phosphate isomerase [Thermodesulfobacteriota bacterium]